MKIFITFIYNFSKKVYGGTVFFFGALQKQVIVRGDHYYLVDGHPATADNLHAIHDWCPVREDSGRQEVERPVILRDYKLSSVVSVRMDGKDFVIT